MVTSDAGMRGGKPVPYKHLVDEAMRLASHPPSRVIIVNRGLDTAMSSAAGRDLDYATLRAQHVGASVPCEWLESSEPSYILYTSGTTGQAEGRAARHRRLCGRAGGIDARHLLRGSRRDDVHHQRHRLGRRPLVHRLRAAAQRIDDDHVRGPADPARSRHLVEDRRRAQGADDVQLADGDPRAEKAGSGVHEGARPVVAAVSVSRRRAARRADRALGGGLAGRRDRRQLLADRERLADPVGAARGRGDAAQVRQPVVSGVRLRRAGCSTRAPARKSAPTRKACSRSCRRCRRGA